MPYPMRERAKVSLTDRKGEGISNQQGGAMSYEDNYDQTARWDAESVREAEQRTQHRSTRSSAERQN